MSLKNPRRRAAAIPARCMLLTIGALWAGLGAQAVAATPEFHLNIQYDRVHSSVDSGYELDRDRLRRARLALQWKPETVSGLSFKGEYDFASEVWTDLYAAVQHGPGQWRIGQFKQPFGMETLTSDKDALFMESAAASAFGIDRRLGVGYALDRSNWHAFISTFGEDLGGNNAGIGTSARLVWTPLGREARILHLGFALARENPDSSALRIRLRPEISVGDLRLVDSGSIDGIDHVDRQGIELAWRSGPLLVQSEHLRLYGHSENLSNLDADASQFSASWLLTGEMRPYGAGVFGSPTPAGSTGALELVARWNSIHMESGVARQKQQSSAIGINWYLRKHARLMLDAIRTRGGNHFDGGSMRSRVDSLQARIQLAF